jgi:hypothetical protein
MIGSLGRFGCEPSTTYNATLLELEAAAPNVWHELLLPVNSSTLFSGTSFMREVIDNVITANLHRLLRVESCEADEALRVSCTVGKLQTHSQPNTIRRWTFAGNSTCVTIDNHWLQSSLHAASLRRFLRQQAFDFAVIMPPHPDSYWHEKDIQPRDPAEVSAVLEGKIPKPSWWIDLDAKGSTNLTQLCWVYHDVAMHVVRMISWRAAETGCSPKQNIRDGPDAARSSRHKAESRLCQHPDCVAGHHLRRHSTDGHQCNPGVPTWFAVHLSRLRCLLVAGGCDSPKHSVSRFEMLPDYAIARSGFWEVAGSGLKEAGGVAFEDGPGT